MKIRLILFVLVSVVVFSYGLNVEAKTGGLELVVVSSGSLSESGNDFVVLQNTSPSEISLKGLKFVKRVSSGKESSLKSWSGELVLKPKEKIVWFSKSLVGFSFPVLSTSTTASLASGSDVLVYVDKGVGFEKVDEVSQLIKGSEAVVLVESTGKLNPTKLFENQTIFSLGFKTNSPDQDFREDSFPLDTLFTNFNPFKLISLGLVFCKTTKSFPLSERLPLDTTTNSNPPVLASTFNP
jgi:hypothetical protein